jgi:hypothetical protein
LEVPPAVARSFVKDMRAFFAEPNTIKADARVLGKGPLGSRPFSFRESRPEPYIRPMPRKPIELPAGIASAIGSCSNPNRRATLASYSAMAAWDR